MSLFKKMSDPEPGGGDIGAGPDPREQVRSVMSDRFAPDQEVGGKVVDSTALIMGGVAASGRIDSVRRAAQEINLQDTFDVRLTVFAEDGQFSAHVIQPAAEQYVGLAVEGQDVRVKFDPEDRSLVWIDWAGSATT